MINLDKLEFNILGDLSTAKKCLVFVHGWKGNKESFVGMAQSFGIKDAVWMLPQAPYPVEGESDSFSWSFEYSPGRYERKKPMELLLNFFKSEVFSRFDSRDVYLLGFSQGGLVCFEMLRVIDMAFGGVFPIGGFIADQNKDIKRINDAQVNTPVLIGHGESDEIISIEESRLAYNLLSKESKHISLETYSGGHKIGYSFMKKVREIIEQKY